MPEYYNRATGLVEKETVLGDGMLRLAYGSRAGRFCMMPLFWVSLFSRLMGVYANCSLSRRRIERTIASLNIDMDDYVVPEGGYRCFNDFFTRRLREGARPFCKEGLASPADCRLTVYQHLDKDTCVPVKGREFTVAELLGEPGASYVPSFKDGALAVFRLCPADYHRFHFPDDGKVLAHWKMKGHYHSVNPMALGCNLRVFTENVREVSMLELERHGLCAFIEVGAFGVATIRQTYSGDHFSRGQEKGYFAFGGSTIIMVFQRGKVEFDQDLLAQLPYETLVKAGQHIAK